MFTLIFLYMYCWAEKNTKDGGFGFAIVAVFFGFIELAVIRTLLA